MLLTRRISEDFVDRLAMLDNPLVRDALRARRTAARAEQIVDQVLADVLTKGSRPRTTGDPWLLMNELHAAGISISAVTEAKNVLFETAFPALLEVMSDHPRCLAGALHRGVSADLDALTAALHTSSALSVATKEVIDPAALASHLTDRQAQIFEMLWSGHSIRSIAAKLHISVKTAKNHQTDIAKKLGVIEGGRGWAMVTTRARELKILVIVPLLGAVALIGEAADAIGSLLN